MHHHIRSVTGWALDYIVSLDVHCPGVAGNFLRASDERRQVVAARLAVGPKPRDSLEASELGKFIVSSGHSQILAAAFESVPTGMRGALGRAGPQPHPRSFYSVVYEVLARDEHIASVVKQLDKIDLVRLRVSQRLPRDICSVEFNAGQLRRVEGW